MNYRDVLCELQSQADPKQAGIYRRFFKTGPGEYGEGDQFYGVKVPFQRTIAKKFNQLGLKDIRKLLAPEYHEARNTGVLILIGQYESGGDHEKERIYRFYMHHRAALNNWDLIDLSAPKIAGAYLYNNDRSILFSLAQSGNRWERRIAIMAPFFFIRKRDFNDTLNLARILLHDPEDLIHKAVGWMLREIGKCDRKTEEAFLRPVYPQMPRTMLRYAIEKFPESVRRNYLAGKIGSDTERHSDY